MIIFSKTTISFVKRLKSLSKSIIADELRLKVGRTKFHFNRYLYPIDIVVFEDERATARLGYFQSNLYQIGINKSLMLADKNQLKNVLRHELIHYLQFLTYGNSTADHGKEFKELCHKFNYGPDISNAYVKLEKVFSIQSTTDNSKHSKLLQKIQKLMELSKSENIHEAELATIKANNLLIKHNLQNYDEVFQNESEQDQQNFYLCKVLTFKKANAKLTSIYEILETFMVKPVINYGKSIVYLEAFGLKSNVEIAEYIAHFLNEEMEQQWNQIRLEKNLKGLRAKNSFFRGLATGYKEKQKQHVKTHFQNDTKALSTLTLKLQDKVQEYYAGQKSDSRQQTIDRNAYSSGLKSGKSLSLRFGIGKRSSGSKSNQTKEISYFS